MVVGESGLGKSTCVNSLFLSDLYANRKIPPVEERVTKTTEIEKTTMEIEEKGVKVRMYNCSSLKCFLLKYDKYKLNDLP